MKRGFPHGTVVQYKDPYAEDRSYRVVFNWDEAIDTVQMKLTITMPREPEPDMETAHTDHLEIIGWCDAQCNMTWA